MVLACDLRILFSTSSQVAEGALSENAPRDTYGMAIKSLTSRYRRLNSGTNGCIRCRFCRANQSLSNLGFETTDDGRRGQSYTAIRRDDAYLWAWQFVMGISISILSWIAGPHLIPKIRCATDQPPRPEDRHYPSLRDSSGPSGKTTTAAVIPKVVFAGFS